MRVPTGDWAIIGDPRQPDNVYVRQPAHTLRNDQRPRPWRLFRAALRTYSDEEMGELASSRGLVPLYHGHRPAPIQAELEEGDVDLDDLLLDEIDDSPTVSAPPPEPFARGGYTAPSQNINTFWVDQAMDPGRISVNDLQASQRLVQGVSTQSTLTEWQERLIQTMATRPNLSF